VLAELGAAIVIDIKAGSPSNISVFPQPGLAANMAAIGGLAPLGDKSRDWVKTNFAAGSSGRIWERTKARTAKTSSMACSTTSM